MKKCASTAILQTTTARSTSRPRIPRLRAMPLMVIPWILLTRHHIGIQGLQLSTSTRHICQEPQIVLITKLSTVWRIFHFTNRQLIIGASRGVMIAGSVMTTRTGLKPRRFIRSGFDPRVLEFRFAGLPRLGRATAARAWMRSKQKLVGASTD